MYPILLKQHCNILPMTKKLIELKPHQKKVLDLLRSGCILVGGVGSGKSITGLAYYFIKECGGIIENGYPVRMNKPKDLFIITTPKKRDTLDWVLECGRFLLVGEDNKWHIKVTIDSWNNIRKYENISGAFFIFDEHKAIGYGAWAHAFINISKRNNWIILTATPGDTWIEYMPVFVANGFYKNKTDFVRNHVIYNPRANFPKIDRYVNCSRLERYKNAIEIRMDYWSPAAHHVQLIKCQYNIKLYKTTIKTNWDPFLNEPIRNASGLCFNLRKIVNSDKSRLEAVKGIIQKTLTNKVIIFYTFNYELDMLRTLKDEFQDYIFAEYNGHCHDLIPDTPKWIYLVQYTSGCEAWNCIKTNTIIYYSLDYSYKRMLQASGRIDRNNTPFQELFYYLLVSDSSLDQKILHSSLKEKKEFNENEFVRAIKK